MPVLTLPFLDELIALRRDLHAHPELAYQETRTSAMVAQELQRYGLEVHCGLARTGVVGVLRSGTGKGMIGLRADMDALPMEEKNSFSHRSCHEGLMHACGHDGHTAMLLGAARHLAGQPDFDGAAVFIFQPAEESEGGADAMLREGLFDRFPVDAVFGLHNWPGLPTGHIAVLSGPVMAGTCGLEIRLRGQGCHAAMPHQGSDVILAASQLVSALQGVVSRNLDPCEAAVLSITQFHAGESAWNILPEEAVLRGTLRTFKPEVQQMLEAGIRRICDGVAAASGIVITPRFCHRYPATVNQRQAAECCARVATRVVGPEQVHTDLLPSMGAEDFAYMLQQKPGCYVWLGNGPLEGTQGGECNLHSPFYDFNDELLATGVSYWVELVRQRLPRSGSTA